MREINQKNWRGNHQYIYLENRVFATWEKVPVEGTFANDSNFASLFSKFYFSLKKKKNYYFFFNKVNNYLTLQTIYYVHYLQKRFFFSFFNNVNTLCNKKNKYYLQYYTYTTYNINTNIAI